MTGGIVRGVGKQTVGAVCNLVGFYIIGLPIGVSLMFSVKMGIVGEPHSSVSAKVDCIPAWFSVLHIQYMNTLNRIHTNGFFISCCRAVDRLLNFCRCASCIFHNISV